MLKSLNPGQQGTSELLPCYGAACVRPVTTTTPASA